MLDGKLFLAISCLLLAKTDLEKVLDDGVVDHALINKAKIQIKKALRHLEIPSKYKAARSYLVLTQGGPPCRTPN